MLANREEQIIFAKELLGPVFYEFCAKLHSYLISNTLDNPQESIVLYVARAGLRLKYLYLLYSQLNNYQSICDEADFYVSRLAAAKGCLEEDFEYVAPIIIREYSENSIVSLLKGVVNQNIVYPEKWQYLNSTIENFNHIYWGGNPTSQSIRKYFIEQSKLLKKYIEKTTKYKKRVFLVDSGWTGNTQAMLMRRFTSKDWTGLHFGKWDYRKIFPSHFSQIIGLCLDDQIHNNLNPRSSIFHYHHLIEDPLEIKFSSTKEYMYDELTGKVAPDTLTADESMIAPHQEDTHFRGIVEYFYAQQSSSLEEIYQKAQLAYSQLERLILFPKKEELAMMIVRERSADFGKDESNSILIEPTNSSPQEKRRRIRQALWKQGQVALEFPPAFALLIQHLRKFKPSV